MPQVTKLPWESQLLLPGYVSLENALSHLHARQGNQLACGTLLGGITLCHVNGL